MYQTHSQKGRSMIEMIAVLAIIGIITVGAIAGINQGFVKYRTSKTYTEIRAINQGVAGMYAYLRTYPNHLDWAEACESNVFPSGCESDNASAINPFGGNYAVRFNADGTMTISASGIPQAACTELQQLTWGNYARGNTGSCTNSYDGNVTFSITFD